MASAGELIQGNMLTRDGWTQEWNGENRLIRMTKGAQRLEFDYDYMGRRIFKKVYNGEGLEKHLKFVYDGYKLIEELDGMNGDAVLRRYAWQSEVLGLDVPLMVSEGGATYYYHTDANKNITELTDVDGAVVAHYEYSPFGQQTAATGAYAAANPFRFSSEYFDEETQLIYYNYRYYSPEMGRWLSRDPIEEQGGWNLYGMVRNNPIQFVDHNGEEVITVIVVGVGIAAGLLLGGCGDSKPGKSPGKNLELDDLVDALNAYNDVKSVMNAIEALTNEDNTDNKLIMVEDATQNIWPGDINPALQMRVNILSDTKGIGKPKKTSDGK